MWQLDKQEQTLAWARYLFWADLALGHLDAYTEGDRLNDEWQDWWRFFALLSGWYAAEYVVIEGWHNAELHDQIIDEALARWLPVVNILRRYRNGVFHYQPNLIESKFMPIFENSEQTMFWVHYLHSEFLRYFWSYAHDVPGNGEQRAEFRESVLGIVGWIPSDIVEARALRLRQIAAEANQMTAGHVGAAAEDLRLTAQEARAIASKQVAKYRELCRSFLLKT